MRVCPVREEEQDSTVADLAERVFLYKVGRAQIPCHLFLVWQSHKALPEGPTLVQFQTEDSWTGKFGQPEPCDGEEESVVDVVGELGVQVDVEAAGHTVLALAPGKSSFGEGTAKVQTVKSKSEQTWKK